MCLGAGSAGPQTLDGLGRPRAQPARGARHRDEPRDDVERLACLDEPLELCELLFQPDGVDGTARAAKNLRVRGRHGLLAVAPKRFVKLLAGPDADELHLDVAPGLLAGEVNHVVREIDDLY